MNIYREYFETLKLYLEILNVDSEKGILGCNEFEINKIEKEKGKLPIAYQEYLTSIGKNYLFEFMDAEDMSYDSLEYINEFGEEVLKNNSFEPNQNYFIISERRNDYISFVYSDTDNPKVWIISEYWDDEREENNLTVRAERFTDLITSFFASTLHYKPFGFNWISPEVENPKIHIRDLYNQWVKGLRKIHQMINSEQESKQENILIKKLNETFLNYYRNNKVDTIKFGIEYDDIKVSEDYTISEKTKKGSNDEFPLLKKMGLIILSIFIISLVFLILLIQK